VIFDCSGPAELFMQKRKGGPRQPLRYRWVYHRGREVSGRSHARMQVGDERFDGDEFQRPYESRDYPLYAPRARLRCRWQRPI